MEFIYLFYPWVKALHIIAVISWMAGLLYLPRLFVHHVEQRGDTPSIDPIFQMMEEKLFRRIMGPAMVVAWLCGLLILFLFQSVSFSEIWMWVKLIMVFLMSWYHSWLGREMKLIAAGKQKRTGKSYRLLNEVPTGLMIVIIVLVIVRPF